jgi:hypothetical protein
VSAIIVPKGLVCARITRLWIERLSDVRRALKHATAVGYGSCKSSGLQLIVTVSVTGQDSDVKPVGTLELVDQILAGKIPLN